MNEIRLRHAFFRVEPIRNIVGQGDKLAYYIVVTKGATLARSSHAEVPVDTSAGNDSDYLSACGDADGGMRRSWLTRLLARLAN
jgi:hypothetical protein